MATLLAGCATKGAVRRVENELVVLRTVTARQDSARAADLGRLMAMQERILDSLASAREALRQFRGEMTSELLSVQASLVQIQELTGQSQRRLSELRRELDDRTERLLAPDTAVVAPAADTTGAPPPLAPTPDQLFQASLQELRLGRLSTARAGFQEFLRTYPTHAQVSEALYSVGETFSIQQPDSAVWYYTQVVQRFPRAAKAATSLYKTGILAEQRGDRTSAAAIYRRVIDQYSRSDEANLARGRLAALSP